MDSVLVQLCRVYDYNKGGINLLTFLKRVESMVERPPEWLDVERIDRRQLGTDISICHHQPRDMELANRLLVQLVDKLREWRKHIVAHYNDQIAVFDTDRFRFNNRWELHDLKQLIDQAVAILDRYAFSRGRDIRYTECFDGSADRDAAHNVIRDCAAAAPPVVKQPDIKTE